MNSEFSEWSPAFTCLRNLFNLSLFFYFFLNTTDEAGRMNDRL